VQSGGAFGLSTNPDACVRAWAYAADAASRWHAQLAGYQCMPVDELLCLQGVELEVPLSTLLGHAGRETCTDYGEEGLNQRGRVAQTGGTHCRGCAASRRYYRSI
jgi:hypothetical protein